MERFHKLFWEVYAKNCEIDNEVVNTEDIESIKKMDREKLCKHLRLFIGGLLEFKKQVKNISSSELAERNMQFESIIAKQEQDIRTHIAKHYQLRLEIESLKNTIDDLSVDVSKEKHENKELRFKLVQQDKLIEQYKLRMDVKRKNTESRKKNFFLELDNVVTVENAKSSRSTTKILTDRGKFVPNTLQITKKLLGASKSLKSRLGHSRCKSEFAKTLKILIPQ